MKEIPSQSSVVGFPTVFFWAKAGGVVGCTMPTLSDCHDPMASVESFVAGARPDPNQQTSQLTNE